MIDDKDIEKMEAVFAIKKDLQEIKDGIFEFKSEILTGQDKILKELKSLTQEKIVKDAQEKREKEVLKIHNEALKRSKILTDEENLKISQASVF